MEVGEWLRVCVRERVRLWIEVEWSAVRRGGEGKSDLSLHPD
jgi:hypothetical protein